MIDEKTNRNETQTLKKEAQAVNKEAQAVNKEAQAIDHHWMEYAFNLAQQAQELGEVPVGAVLVKHETGGRKGRVIGEGFNRPISQKDSTAHAEINAIRDACKRMDNYRLPNSTLYVTLEPCAMCAGAIIHSRISRVVIATREPRAGAAGSVLNILENGQLNHRCEVDVGVMQEESSKVLKSFFKARRNKAEKTVK